MYFELKVCIYIISIFSEPFSQSGCSHAPLDPSAAKSYIWIRGRDITQLIGGVLRNPKMYTFYFSYYFRVFPNIALGSGYRIPLISIRKKSVIFSLLAIIKPRFIF